MDRYDIRSSFLPDLSGLHVRIYQFKQLLQQNLPILSNHLEDLQVDPAYVSQWFLSFFAVTCPLPMLFRIYDVIFAEGAPETLMRVALSLMQKNESRLLACTELEDAMQLLLSRGLWDCYHYNADEFVHDFVSLTGVVSPENLFQLEQGYRESQLASANAVRRTSDVTTAASRFLGRIWASSSSALPKAVTLSPGLSAPSRPLSMLRRTASKQSLASTLNSMEASSASVVSSASTVATTVSRDSSNTTDDTSASRESTPVVNGGNKFAVSGKQSEDRYLHSQIEDLLTALSELQRNHALLASQLEKEREEREEDGRAVRSLLDGLKKNSHNKSTSIVESDASIETMNNRSTPTTYPNAISALTNASAQYFGSSSASSSLTPKTFNFGTGGPVGIETTEHAAPSTDELSRLFNEVEQRFGGDERSEHRRSSTVQSKSGLKQELAQAKEQLVSAMSLSQEYNRKIQDLDQELSSVKDQLRDSHGHSRNLHQDKQRLEKQIHDMRARASATESVPDLEIRSVQAQGGLRELKLGRSRSTPSQVGMLSRRMSTLPKSHESTILTLAAAGDVPPANEHEALLLELVQAKTAEAIARQEADEAKQKLESLRRAYGLAPGESPPTAASAASSAAAAAASTAGAAASAAMGVLGRFTTSISESNRATVTTTTTTTAPSAASAPAPAASGGFWGWRR
jgi:hypothetical protein